MRLDRLLREEKTVSDLAVHEAVGDELKHFDLAGRRLLLELLERTRERDHIGTAIAASLCNRVEAAAVVHVSGQDLLTLGSVHGSGRIGLDTQTL
jgi:hypothetical protein